MNIDKERIIKQIKNLLENKFIAFAFIAIIIYQVFLILKEGTYALTINKTLTIGAIILILCIVFSKMLYKRGVPVLLIFMGLGMMFGTIGRINYNDYNSAQNISSLALVFIMFYGGFGTSWKIAKPVFGRAVLLSSAGTFMTAIITGVFAGLICKSLGFDMLLGFLLGAVLASTDAASVFSILRSRKMELKGGVAPILEVESGSNDPFAYMLTIVMLAIITNSGASFIPLLIVKQIFIGIITGVLLGNIAKFVLRNITFEIESFHLIFVMAIAILGYALSEPLGGNGFLSVYISGIIIGNSKIFHRKSLTNFFDGVSWLMQIMLFFMLGLLSNPHRLFSFNTALSGLAIIIAMLVIARPVSVFALLAPFKMPKNQKLFISWVGIRGAASIAFAIYAVTGISSYRQGTFAEQDTFVDIVFIVVLISVLLQGSLIPYFAKKWDIIDETQRASFKSLGDMEDESYNQLLEYNISSEHKWANKTIVEAEIPKDVLIVMIKRGNKVIVPNGQTVLMPDDTLILSGENLEEVLS